MWEFELRSSDQPAGTAALGIINASTSTRFGQKREVMSSTINNTATVGTQRRPASDRGGPDKRRSPRGERRRRPLDGYLTRKALSPARGTAVAPAAKVNWFPFAGWVILTIVLGIAAHKLGAEPVWIGIGALALLGIGIIASVRPSTP